MWSRNICFEESYAEIITVKMKMDLNVVCIYEFLVLRREMGLIIKMLEKYCVFWVWLGLFES